ncbi:GGDEF domain-containing protein [Dokdonella sp.]|uniref:GGDEF domain-containing protein n=1 Tax=Dokdonella sp. TaxID=2291710 RepID=UPI003783B064
MNFDIKSAMMIASLLTLCVGASLSFAASRYPAQLRTAMRIWIGGLLIEALALLSAVPRGDGWDGPFAIILTNTMYVLSYAVMGRAVEHFANRPPSRAPLLLVALTFVILCLFTLAWPAPRWRITFDTLPIVLLQLGVARAVMLGRERLRPAERLTGSLFIACAALALLRGLTELFGPMLGLADFRPTVLTLVLVSSSILPMLGTIGFMLMCGDRMNDDLTRLAMTDPLTGVHNRRTLARMADHEIDAALQEGRPLSLLAIDVDHFKRINDAFGHDSGDEALLGLVRLMRESLAVDAPLSRIGGEEFAVLLPGVSELEACVLAEYLRQHVASALLSSNGHPLRLTVSVGVASIDAETRDLRALLRNADRALYAAKHNGRNRCVAHSSLAPTPALGMGTAARA